MLILSFAFAATARAEHPNLIMTGDDVARLKDNVENVEWAKRYFDGLKADVDHWFAAPPVIPEKGGGYTQNYVSPENGRPLSFNPAEPRRHLEPVSGKYFEGAAYDAAWRDIQHIMNAQQAHRAGLVYVITGDEEYARRARAVLVGYAERYHKFPPQGGPAGLGRITAQALDEARWLIEACAAYDLTAGSPALTDADRELIIKKLLVPAARHIQGYPFGVHNIQIWESMSILMAGLISGRESLSDSALQSLRKLLEKGVRPEGLWYETSINYHFFAAKPFETLTAVCRSRGLDVCGAPALRRMLTLGPSLAMPDGAMPALNDGNRKDRTLYSALRQLVAARYFWNDESLDPAIHALGEKLDWKKVELPVFEYYVRPAAPPAEWSIPAESVHLPGAGVTILKKGGQYALLKYNPPCGGHDHPDKPALLYYTDGRELFPSRGTIYYGHPLYRGWYRRTEAHNTVMVDGKQQNAADCRATDFGESETESWVEVKCENIASGVTVTRRITIDGENLRDRMTIHSDKPHTYDWFMHADSVPPETPAEPLEASPNTEIVFASRTQKGGSEAPFVITWQPERDNEKPQLTAMKGGGEFFTGAATGFYPDEKFAVVMWRQTGTDAVFEAVTTDD